MFDNVQPVSITTPSPAEDVDRAEAELKTRFPKGYREFVTRFGRGVYGGLVRIYPPALILAGSISVGEWRKRIGEYWFWDEGPLPQARALESVVIGDTVGGDEFVFHPDAPDTIYVLPHDFEQSFLAGEGLEAALEWMFRSDVIVEAFEDNSFEPI